MSKNNMTEQRNDNHRAPRDLSTLEQEVLSLFVQLSEADQQHVIRVLQALRDTAS